MRVPAAWELGTASVNTAAVCLAKKIRWLFDRAQPMMMLLRAGLSQLKVNHDLVLNFLADLKTDGVKNFKTF